MKRILTTVVCVLILWVTAAAAQTPPTATATDTPTPTPTPWGSTDVLIAGNESITGRNGRCFKATHGRKSIQYIELADGATAVLYGSVSTDPLALLHPMTIATWTASTTAPLELTASYGCLWAEVTCTPGCAYVAYVRLDE